MLVLCFANYGGGPIKKTDHINCVKKTRLDDFYTSHRVLFEYEIDKTFICLFVCLLCIVGLLVVMRYYQIIRIIQACP